MKLRSVGLFALALTRGPERGHPGKPSSSKVACIVMSCLFAIIAAPAQTFTSLFSFDGSNGSAPHYGYLVQGIDGDFYGMTGDDGTGWLWHGFQNHAAGSSHHPIQLPARQQRLQP